MRGLVRWEAAILFDARRVEPRVRRLHAETAELAVLEDDPPPERQFRPAARQVAPPVVGADGDPRRREDLEAAVAVAELELHERQRGRQGGVRDRHLPLLAPE